MFNFLKLCLILIVIIGVNKKKKWNKKLLLDILPRGWLKEKWRWNIFTEVTDKILMLVVILKATRSVWSVRWMTITTFEAQFRIWILDTYVYNYKRS